MNQTLDIADNNGCDLEKRIHMWMNSGDAEKALKKALDDSAEIVKLLEKERILDPRSLDEPITL